MAEDVMTITPLGSGQEVGRSCHVLEFRDLNILLDCGIHPGYEGMNGLPFLDRIEPETIDIILITHFHLDHAASLPYFTERTGFKGRIFMTHPTKAVLRLLLGDYLRLLQMKNAKAEEVLYTESELLSCLEKIELIDFHQTVTVKGLTFYALNAGHVLGACMYWLEIGGRSVLYTGDYSMEDDRHLMAAELPSKKPDVLIVESTYGVQVHASKKERETRFTGTVERVVMRGGRCLIPVFALGRAQELLLILDEFWRENPQLQKIPIYYASKMASRALRVYQTYSNMMNARIREQMDIANPFSFTWIQNLKSIDVNSFDDSGPSVVFASPGMLQSGVSRQLFDRWAADPKNGVLIAGYAVEHTLAKEIMNQPKEVVTLEGRRQPLNCFVDYVSFSAHVDFVQNRSFITQVEPKHIILVHGQKDEMGRLKSALLLQFRQLPENKRPTVTMPPNLQEVKLKFARRRSAKVMGKLAEQDEEPQEGQEVNGIMVTHNFSSKIMTPEDLSIYTPLRVGSISSKLHVPFSASVDTLMLFLNEMFMGVTQTILDKEEEDSNTITVLGLKEDQIIVTVGTVKGIAVVEWDASPANDVIADAIVALILHSQSSPASIRLTSKPCRHPSASELEPQRKIARDDSTTNTASRLKLISDSLKDQFNVVESIYESHRATYEIKADFSHDTSSTDLSETGELLCHVTVEFEDEYGNHANVTVDCVDEKLGQNVRESIRSLASAAGPMLV
jgi:cleavage and polyadenylation specificity factor subunit 3